MVKEIQHTSIKRVLDNLTEHPLLRDITLDQVIRHTIRFIGINGFPKFYIDKGEDVPIECFRGLLPCDLISIIQVKDLKTGVCLRGMTDNFAPGMVEQHEIKHPVHSNDVTHNAENPKKWYIPPSQRYIEEPAFKTQGRVIYTSFPEGRVCVMYKAIPVDDDGYPLLIDNENYLAALEAYIKMKVFSVKFDTGKINAQVLQNAKQEYSWLAGQLRSEFQIPSLSEMQSITSMLNTLIPQVRHFDNGFKNMSDREYLRRHQ